MRGAGIAALVLLVLAGAVPPAGAGESAASPLPFQGRIRATLSGFTDAHPDSVPKRNKPYAEVPALALADPARATVVIWSHGTTDSTMRENCSAEGNAVPPSLRALEREGVYLWFVCSEVSLRATPETAGDFVYLRMDEVAEAIHAFLDLGVRPERIFLAGHSAGGWVSLMLARDWGERIGGIIAYAPAFARPRADIRRFPWFRREHMPRQVEEMRRARVMRALVFAYERDIFDRPQELRFLAETWPRTVRMVSYSCDAEHDHGSHIRDCRLDLSTAEVRRFVLGR